jgi:hypothetical protein
MKSSTLGRGRVTRVLGVMVVGGLLAGLGSSFAASDQPGVPASSMPPPPSAPPQPAPAPAPPQATTQPLSAQNLEAWHATMSRTPVPKKGCFKSSYPSTAWQEESCATAPQRPYPLARGVRPNTVGNGNDFSAQVSGSNPLPPISSAIGSFDSVTGVESEADYGNANSFSLQLTRTPLTHRAVVASRALAGSSSYSPTRESHLYSTG